MCMARLSNCNCDYACPFLTSTVKSLGFSISKLTIVWADENIFAQEHVNRHEARSLALPSKPGNAIKFTRNVTKRNGGEERETTGCPPPNDGNHELGWRSVHGRSTAFFHSCKRSGTFQDEGDEKKSLREYEHGKSEEDFEFRGEQLRAFILPYAEEKMIRN
uniref:Uncharacterized protein n=1 Tax=Vespula pensylvanica TaxID=30213 RepID=A0A834P2R1_VESPE|nr:hypothetical protein H0235_008055 [Vespula pensylvanica]